MSLDEGPLSGTASDANLHAPGGPVDPELLVAQSGWLRSVARNLVRDPWGAEDVAQEALLAALATPPPSAPDGSHLRAWLGRVAFNLSRLDLRSGGRRRARERVVARAESLPSVADELESRSTRGELRRALRALDEPHRVVLQLRYFDGLDTEAIAQRLGVSELAVRKRLWRAREKLRAELEPRARRTSQAAWLPFTLLRRAWRLESLGIAAASLAVLLALELDSRERPAGAREVAAHTARERQQLAPEAPSLPATGAGESTPVRHPHDGRIPRLPPAPPAPEAPTKPPETLALFAGLVLDLDGAPRAGLVVCEAAEPALALATSDALGGFRLERQSAPAELLVQPGAFATVVPGQYAPGAEEALLLVAPAAPFEARVLDEQGRPVPGARLELVARSTAFAHIARPVRLAREVVAVLASADGATFASAALPRAPGLLLRASAPGFERVEYASEACASARDFLLRPEGGGPELAGTILGADGRPAVGARVRLALAETHTDGRGLYRLPLRGVESDSALVVDDAGHARHLEQRFGKRLAEGSVGGDFDVILERPLVHVQGRLTGLDTPFDGWRVVAFERAEGEPVEGTCTGEGRFELWLPRAAHTLVALAPELVAAHVLALDKPGAGEIELPVRAETSVREHVGLRADDGRPLAHARVELRLVLGPREVSWGWLTSDARGSLRFERALSAEVALSVRHVALGPGPRNLAPGAEPVLARASTLRVEGASSTWTGFRLRDGQGTWLASEGPLGPEPDAQLLEGAGAVRFLPPEARWIEFVGAGSQLLRLPLAPVPGAAVTLTPVSLAR